MIRITTLLWIALLVVAGGTVMHVSYQVRHVEKRLSELARDTRKEQETIGVLNAEWESLNDPQRIDGLAKRELTLEPTPIARIVTLDAIPLKMSEDQLAKFASTTNAKPAKGTAPAVQVATRKPAMAGGTPVPQPAAHHTQAASPSTIAAHQTGQPLDGVGLILARVERHE